MILDKYEYVVLLNIPKSELIEVQRKLKAETNSPGLMNLAKSPSTDSLRISYVHKDKNFRVTILKCSSSFNANSHRHLVTMYLDYTSLPLSTLKHCINSGEFEACLPHQIAYGDKLPNQSKQFTHINFMP